MSENLKLLQNNIQKNRFLQCMIIVEGILLLVMAAYCFREKQSYLFSYGDFNVKSDLVEDAENEEGGYYYAFLEENIAETVLLETDVFDLPAGAYDVRIHYTSQVNFDENPYYYNGNGYLYFESSDGELNFDFTRIFLRNSTDSQHEYLRISSLSGSGTMRLCVSYYGLGELTVSSVEVRELIAYRYICFLVFLLVLTFLDLLIYFFFIREHFQYRKELGILTLICVAASLPWISEYSYVGSDFSFHVNRIRLLAEELTLGNYFPAIYSQDLNGYGYAAPLFYCQFFLYVPAFLYASGFSLTVAYNVYVCLISIATCLIMYYCALKIFKRTNQALLASALYTFSAWRLTNIMTRSAVGEFTAQTFLPLVVLGFYNIYSAPRHEKIAIRQYWPVIVGLTGVFLSHLLSTEMCAIVIFIFCLLFVKRTFEPQRLIALLKAASLTFLVCLAQLTSLLDSLGMDITVNQTEYHIQGIGVEFIQLFNSVVNNYQHSYDGTTTEVSMNIGLPLTVGLILFVVYMAKRGMKKDKEKLDSFAAVCFGLSLLMIAFTSRYTPYDYLDFLPDFIYKLFTIYQYPSRWLVFVTLFGTFCTASVAGRQELSSLFGKVPVEMLLAIILIINTGQIYSDQMQTSYMAIYKDVNYLNFTTIEIPEYFLYGTDTSEVYYNQLIYDADQMSAGDYRYRDNRWLLKVNNSSESDAVVDIPVFHYDNYIAYDVETGEKIDVSTGENNRIRLTIPAGYSGTVAVKYRIRTLWKLAIAVSLTTDLFLLCYAVFYRRLRRRKRQ